MWRRPHGKGSRVRPPEPAAEAAAGPAARAVQAGSFPALGNPARARRHAALRSCGEQRAPAYAAAGKSSPGSALTEQPARRRQDESERQREMLTDQIERAAKTARTDEGYAAGTELQRDAEGEPLRLALAARRPAAREAPAARSAAPAFEAAARDDKVRGLAARARPLSAPPLGRGGRRLV